MAIFNPIKINIIPPNLLILFSFICIIFFIMALPNFAPRIDRIHVVISIVKHANNIFIFRNANVIPTANASILVAIANIDISFIVNT